MNKHQRHFFALQYNPERYNYNDSDDLIRLWGTACVVIFDSRKARDRYAAQTPAAVAISAKRAHYILGR